MGAVPRVGAVDVAGEAVQLGGGVGAVLAPVGVAGTGKPQVAARRDDSSSWAVPTAASSRAMPPSASAASAKRREALEASAETKPARVGRSWVAPGLGEAAGVFDAEEPEGGSSACAWLVSNITVSVLSKSDALPRSVSVEESASERAVSENGTAWRFSGVPRDKHGADSEDEYCEECQQEGLHPAMAPWFLNSLVVHNRLWCHARGELASPAEGPRAPSAAENR